ncbi:MAG: winged helix-turn-helix domain-containing protein [Candidatus Caldarchaeum sp.]|uniref:ArsR family transcriptional regulator n=1 Tax=Caldiarchaeum subterraneum TaxID=311458 RepID=A0A7J3VSE5_CALS0
MAEHEAEHILFKSLASPIRLSILQLLDKQPLGYTELMKNVGMGGKAASGRFAHHLRILTSSGLIRANEKTKLYELTPKGSRVVKSLETLRSSISRHAGLVVRKSGLFIESFDRNRIAQVLVDEAGVPPKIADKLARLAEEKLEGLKVEYLTAPLIRELVNALLIDQGLEQYRHRLTRLGMPVHDVEKLLNQAAEKQTIHSLVRNASNAVYREYVLQTMLPREAVDAYLSGDVDFEGVDTWAFSIHSKVYEACQEGFLTAVAEADGVEKEIVLKMVEEVDKQQTTLFVKMPVLKHLTIAVYSEQYSGFASDLLGLGCPVLVPAETVGLKSSSRVDLVFSHGPASSEGHSFPPSGLVEGKAAVNLVGLYLKTGGDEKSFWNAVGWVVGVVASSFKRKNEMVSRFWNGLQGMFMLSFVGVEQIAAVYGSNQVEVVRRLWRKCRDISQQGVVVLPCGQASRKSAERFRQLDVLRFGGRQVAQAAPSDSYSSGLGLKKADEVFELVKYLPGGFRVSLNAVEAAEVLDLKPLVLLSPRPKP